MIQNEYKDIVPEIYWDNPSAAARILHIYQKAKREGKHGGYWTRLFEEVAGIPADVETTYEPSELITNEE